MQEQHEEIVGLARKRTKGTALQCHARSAAHTGNARYWTGAGAGADAMDAPAAWNHKRRDSNNHGTRREQRCQQQRYVPRTPTTRTGMRRAPPSRSHHGYSNTLDSSYS